MKNVLEMLITNLVDDASSVVIEETEDNKTVSFTVKVAQSDMGKVIGKQGRVAKSIRTVMKSVAGKEGKRVNVEFVEE